MTWYDCSAGLEAALNGCNSLSSVTLEQLTPAKALPSQLLLSCSVFTKYLDTILLYFFFLFLEDAYTNYFV